MNQNPTTVVLENSMENNNKRKAKASSTKVDFSGMFSRGVARLFRQKKKQPQLGPNNQPVAANSTMARFEYCPSRWRSLELADEITAFPSSFKLISSYEREYSGEVFSMAAGPDGLLFTGSNSRNIRVWRKGQPYGGFFGYHGPNYALLFDSDGRVFAACHDGRVRVWVGGVAPREPPSYIHIQTLPSIQDRLKGALWRKKMMLMRKFQELYWHSFPVICMSFSEDMKFLYTGSTDRTMKVWCLKDWKLVDCKKEHKQMVTAIAAGCQDRVISGSRDGSLIMWQRQEGPKVNEVRHIMLTKLLDGKIAVNALLLQPTETGDRVLYTGLSDGTLLCFMQSDHWRRKDIRSYHQRAVTCLAAAGSPGSLVFSGSKDGKICAWKMDQHSGHHTIFLVLTAHEGPVNCIAAYEDWEETEEGSCQCILYSASRDNTLKTWRIGDGALYGHRVPRGR